MQEVLLGDYYGPVMKSIGSEVRLLEFKSRLHCLVTYQVSAVLDINLLGPHVFTYKIEIKNTYFIRSSCEV